jgi:membrane protein implicated in regulation of membrane protease activity
MSRKTKKLVTLLGVSFLWLSALVIPLIIPELLKYSTQEWTNMPLYGVLLLIFGLLGLVFLWVIFDYRDKDDVEQLNDKINDLTKQISELIKRIDERWPKP